MRHVFVSKSLSSLDKMVRSRLDDYAVLVLVKYAYITPGSRLEQLPQKSSQWVEVTHKVKKVLSWLADAPSKQPEHIRNSYSCVGKVIALGKEVRSVRIGDKVVCAAEFQQADLVRVPEHLVLKIEKKELTKEALIIPFGAHALYLLRRSKVQLGEWICIFGLDIIGLLCAQLAKKIGCNVIVVDHRPERLAVAQQLGINRVINPQDDVLEEEVNLATERQGVDVTLIADSKLGSEPLDDASTPLDITKSIAITRKKGRIVCSGTLSSYENPGTNKEVTIMGVSSYGLTGLPAFDEEPFESRWTAKKNMQTFMHLLRSHELAYEHFMVPCTDFSKIKKEALTTCFGQIVSFEQKRGRPAKSVTALTEQKFVPCVKTEIQVGFLGGRCLLSSAVMNEIKQSKVVKLKSVVNGEISGSKFLGAQELSDEKLLLQDKDIDLVVIGSPHRMHWQQVEPVLQYHKAVLVANPIVTDETQLAELKKLVELRPNALVMVDYHRPYAPFMKKIKNVIQGRRTPMMIHYRMNSAFAAKEKRFESFGAGRIVGQAAHIFDLFYFLTDSAVRSVSVEYLHASRADIFSTDNVSVQLSFEDGSVCSLLFTTLGHEKVGAERMELFFDQKTVVMENWLGLYGFGLPSWFNETVNKPDCGESAFLQSVQNHLKNLGNESFMSLERITQVSELTLLVDRLVCEGGGATTL